ncbi:Hpt domain-containing protein [Lutispora thermophila]|uniref:Hpt domain-containing protein n=1 Tax=Lutispora thermophila DSM 19022 TaxID=1122184 RepID=A0A1M6EJH8_9FIRM|nr:Hpt domain-containing protein [Lutispora thermophila]SHI85637.1 Hpt domain-containing protein [Lutispora thermophila DSM 19022]
MDAMIQYYMEETEDMLQKAEECLIRLEMEYSSTDVNELFRIAHTIKGSSQMVGYEDIGDIMHKIEDMLDGARNNSILFDQSIVSLCFKGLDMVKKMLQHKKEQGSQEMMDDFINDATRIKEMIEAFIRANKKGGEKNATEESAKGIVSSLLNKKPKGKNRFYITFFIEEDAPMVSPVFMMILKTIGEIGNLVYSSIGDSYFSELSRDNEIRTFDIILCTDIEEAELYTYFALSYVERINIVDLSRSKLEENDYCFSNGDDISYIIILRVFMKLYNMLFNESKELNISKEELSTIESLYLEAANACGRMKDKNKISTFIRDFNELFLHILKMCDDQWNAEEDFCSNIRTQMVELTERAYNYTKGKHLFRVFKAKKTDFVNRLRNFMDMVDKASTLIILIDLSSLDILGETEVKALIEMKRQMEFHGIETGVIVDGYDARKIINIFDSIKPLEEFHLFKTELDAILGVLYSQDSFHRIMNKIKDVQYK